MQNLHLLTDKLANGFNNNILNLFTLSALFFGVFVIITKNPILSILFLIGLFLSTSMYLMSLGINFIGLSYLLVYIGAISILFLFILMLINVRISEIVSATSNSIPLAIFVCSLFISNLYKALPLTKDFSLSLDIKYYNKNISTLEFTNENTVLNNILQTYNSTNSIFKSYFYNDLNNVTSVSWDTMLTHIPHINALGNVLFTVYPLWLILSSLILLLAMVGAIVITVKTKN